MRNLLRRWLGISVLEYDQELLRDDYSYLKDRVIVLEHKDSTNEYE